MQFITGIGPACWRRIDVFGCKCLFFLGQKGSNVSNAFHNIILGSPEVRNNDALIWKKNPKFFCSPVFGCYLAVTAVLHLTIRDPEWTHPHLWYSLAHETVEPWLRLVCCCGINLEIDRRSLLIFEMYIYPKRITTAPHSGFFHAIGYLFRKTTRVLWCLFSVILTMPINYRSIQDNLQRYPILFSARHNAVNTRKYGCLSGPCDNSGKFEI